MSQTNHSKFLRSFAEIKVFKWPQEFAINWSEICCIICLFDKNNFPLYLYFYSLQTRINGYLPSRECNNWNYCYIRRLILIVPQHLPKKQCARVALVHDCPDGGLSYLSETIGIMCRGTRATTASPNPPLLSSFRLVRTSYNRCSYVPLTRRATITLMHCPVFRRLTTPTPPIDVLHSHRLN